MKQEIRFCTAADGVRIAYATSGSGSPLVYVANWLTHLELDWKSPIWWHWIRELSQGHTLVRFDARGNGLSDRVVNTLSVDAWAQDLATVANDLELDRFPILGFCQGGATAVAYAVRHPERVSRLVLFNAYVQGAFADDQAAQDSREAEALAEMIEVGWGREATAFRKLFANLMVPGATIEQQRWYADLHRRTVSPEVAARLWRAFHAIDISDLAPQVQVPTLVLHVEGNKMVTFEEGRRLATLIPDARFVPLAGQNHVLLEDEPAWSRFLTEVRNFLGAATSKYARAELQQVLSELTPREREVLTLMADGLNNDQIAERLVIAPKTMRNYATRIYHKLGVDSRAQAIVMARETDFVDASRP